MMEGWTLKGHWLNLGTFALGLLLTGLGSVQSWDAIVPAITPQAVAGFGIAVLAYARSINTERPRASYQERKDD